jgi:hypothetical protein
LTLAVPLAQSCQKDAALSFVSLCFSTKLTSFESSSSGEGEEARHYHDDDARACRKGTYSIIPHSNITGFFQGHHTTTMNSDIERKGQWVQRKCLIMTMDDMTVGQLR